MSIKESHKDRMRTLDAIAAPRKGAAEWVRLVKEVESNRAVVEAEASRRYKAGRTLVRAQLNGGAGKFADEALRYFLAEYNDRAWHHGLRSMPMSFNVLESFFEYDHGCICFRLLPESDYLFSIEDFFDFATQPSTQDVSPVDAMNLKEGVIYNYSAYDDPTVLSMQMEDGLDYIVAGVSMLRRGLELTVLLVAGEKGQADRLKRYTWDQFVKYSDVAPNQSQPDEPVMLKGAPDYVKTYAICRFDLEALTLQVRYLMLDAGRFFVVHSDDPAGLGPLSAKQLGETLRASEQQLSRRGTLWELSKTVLLLPSYILARIEFVKEEGQVTALASQARHSGKVRRALEPVPSESKILYRRISAIRVIRPASSTPAAAGRVYTPPQFQVPVQGFWRVLSDPSSLGHDESGNPILSKTWVRRHTRYSNRPESPKVVYIKSSLTHARRQVDAYRKRMAQEEPNAKKESETTDAAEVIRRGAPGYVYVFRSPAHGRDIYKVGYTERDPESRARELSSTTSNPVHFLVVQAWPVVDGRAAESAAHEALASYRLESSREFFVGQYALLREVIEASIQSWVIR